MAPITMSSMLGCVAAVTDTESPSQLSPAVIQRTWTSLTAGSFSSCARKAPDVCFRHDDAPFFAANRGLTHAALPPLAWPYLMSATKNGPPTALPSVAQNRKWP